MKIYRNQNTNIKDWFICNGFVGKRRVFGAGRTFYEALINALRS